MSELKEHPTRKDELNAELTQKLLPIADTIPVDTMEHIRGHLVNQLLIREYRDVLSQYEELYRSLDKIHLDQLSQLCSEHNPKTATNEQKSDILEDLMADAEVVL